MGIHLPFDAEHMLGYLIAWFSNFTHIDSVIFYLPSIIAPLIVIPIILIFSLYKKQFIGLFAAIISSIGFNYYYRTHLGYTDTDLLIYTLVLFITFSFVAVAKKRVIYYSLIGFLSSFLLIQWHHSAKPLIAGIVVINSIFILLFYRKNLENYFSAIIIFISIVSMPLLMKLISLVISIIIYKILVYKKITSYKIFTLLVAITLFFIFIYLFQNQYYNSILTYLNKPSSLILKDINGHNIVIPGTLKTISESKSISIIEMINATSGNFILYIFSIIGLILLTIKERSAIFLWTFIILGAMAIKLGVRFTTFAVPVASIGIVYFVFWINAIIKNRYKMKFINTIGITLMSLIFFYTFRNILKYNDYIRPVFLKDEIIALKKISSKKPNKDYVISWWDNGWPIWYFTFKNTLIDNGKNGYDNFIVSNIMFSPYPKMVRNMSIYFCDYYSKMNNRGFIFSEVVKKNDIKKLFNSFLISTNKPLDKDFKIYYFFNDELVDKLPTIVQFISTSKIYKKKGKLLLYSNLIKPFDFKDRFIYGSNFRIDRRSGIITYNNGYKQKIGNLIRSNGINFTIRNFYKGTNYNVVIYKNRHVLIVDNYYLNSFFIKSLILNRYDHNLFKPISITNHSKVFELVK